ncbi:MAG: tetratricopeptide repeat protein [Rubripirellula sp.]
MLRIDSNQNSRLIIASCISLCMMSITTAVDRVYDKAGKNVSGKVVQTNSQGLQLEKGGSNQTFEASNILKVLYEGDPPELTKGREFALDGQYDQALAELKKVAFGAIKRDVIKADVAFYLVLCESKLALAGKAKKDEADSKARSFAGNFRDSWHFFDATRLLGDLALAQGDNAKALQYYSFLGKSRSADFKIESVYLQGLVHLKKGDNDSALAEFEKVIGLKAQTTQTARLQVMSKAGKAVGQARGGKPDDGLTLVKGLIAELNNTDIEMAARIYNAQGACYEAKGDDEGAIHAYLHTHLMFSGQPDAHADALKKLVVLWGKVGKPDRAAEARQELQARYPGA